jgi:predicted metal-binding protein
MRTTINSNWATTILVCAKCSKKLKGGFGDKGRTPLAKALKQRGGGKKRKAPFGVIETRCFGICPKGAVVAVDAAHPGTWHLVREGLPIDDAAALLGVGTSTQG